ncbi:Multidrug resistance protein MdtA precursor [Anatilimnocola aggregata]|uniref:Multidrug resistance protein MdtA n=1 Tax=Anatilimnocola aggregata TaxID=2528021 RepID=A0A517YNG2_9BACT|nr:efflux RND transporter periplasmic adaptor subunit [Anatilimnocola aggregata]QDU31762.1 Multidrug resistance protein MdtA precursor [Anatilimnocola aggregata]
MTYRRRNLPNYGPDWRIGLVLLLAAAGCSGAKTSSPEQVRPVKTLVVVAGEATNTRAFPGKVDAANRVQLAFQVPGLLVKLPVKEGQKVAKGEVIAQLRQDEFEARLKTLQSQLDQSRAALRALLAGDRPEERLRREADVRAAEARLANARSEFDRLERLVRSRAASQQDFERAETQYRVAQEDLQGARQLLEIGTIAREEDIDARTAEVRGLEARVVEANLHLTDSTLRAPYDGVIAQRFVEEGQNVAAKAPIVKFQDVDELEVVVDVPESVMAANLQSADILQLEAEFSGVPGLRFPVHVKEIAQRADPTTQTFAVRVAMQAPKEQNVLPGMTATVLLTYRRASILGSRTLVPISAVYKDSSGEQIVWVLNSDNVVSRRPVKLGSVMAGQVEIVDGLKPGERIARAGVSFLREGVKVRDLGDELGGG